ncbi:EF-hand domain-containing protein [Vreelandella titanicae]|uniref:EF-hand domain-containing protein n=1 Tax=Vreelandella titanicae TaxID=664683 RepID=A0A558J3U7_9GAMM|nr:EF-hand domain-containing protein [Halomonas titanicae]TVU88315.1 hypothetical protein FQP89_18855 [Halomonas titanicae]
MANNLTLSVTLTGDNRQLSGTLKDAQGDVREFSTTTERESKKAETALEKPGRQAATVSDHLRETQREARTFGTETDRSSRQATQALAQTGDQAQTVTGHLDQMRGVAVAVGVAMATMGVREFVADTYAAVSSSQQLQASLKTVTGSIENASTAWNTLLGFAAETPFTLDQSVQAFIRMQSLGLNPSLEALRSYGNTASAMGKDMMQMVEAVADATTGEFERLKEFGIRASKEGEQISFTFQGVTTTVANSATAISQYLQQIGENQFAGAMGDQMDTLSGKASNLEDTVYQFYLAIGEAGATEVFESTLANASNTVQFLTDNIDTLASGAEIMAVLIGGRVVVALANVTAAKLVATQQTIAYQLALARMAGVSGTAAASQTALAGATRAASGAMMLLGGPAGAVALAGLAIYTFRDELGLTVPQIDANTTAVNKLTNGLDDMNQAAAQLTLTSLVGQLAEVRAQAEVTAEAFTKVGQIEGDGGGGFLGVDVTAQTDAVRELGETSNATQQEAANLEAAIALVEGRIGQLGERNREVTPTVTEIGDASETTAAKTSELTKATAAQADALEELYNRLRPGRREVVELADDMRTLTLAIATGTGNVAENIQMIGLLQQQYIEAQNDTDELAAKTVDAAFTMEGAWDEVRLNGLRRLDDGFVSLWEGAIDGSLNAGELMKRALAQTLAEMAHMAITRPITVQLATSMGFGGSGAGAQQGSGGFNMGSLKSGWDTVSGLWGGGSAASTAATGYTGALGTATSTGYGGALGSAVSGAASAGGGFMGAASAAAPWLAGGMLVDEVLGLGIVDGIVSGISGLFGGGKTPFSGRFGTTGSIGSGTFEHQDDGEFYGQSALGYTGFLNQGTERLQRAGTGSKDWAAELTTASVEMDNLVASIAQTPEELEAMRSAVQGLQTSSRSAADIIDFALNERPRAALDALGGQFGEFVRGLSGGIAEVVQQAQLGQQAHTVLAGSMDRLNLQFNATSAGAYQAASNIAEYAGGVNQLTQLQDQYYQAYFSEAERAANLQADLAESLNAMGLALPANEAGFRALVEAQNQNTDSGARNYVQLLQLSGAFDQLQDMLGQTDTGVRSFTDELSAARDALATAEDQTRRAYEVFSNQAFDQQIELLNLMGDAEGALALERERELATIDESLRPTQERIWAIQDEITAQQNATAAARNYQRELVSVRDQLNQQFAQNAGWLDQQQATSGTPETNLATAQEQLARQLVLAENGDRDALQGITQYADRVLEANRAFNASSAAGQRIQEDVYAAIQALPESISAEQYLAEEIRDALQSVVISAMPSDERLAVELSRELTRLDTNQLTVAQVRTTLSPLASDAEIGRLISQVDKNGDGIITEQELANQRLSGLAGGIGAALKPMFDGIDLDASGLIDWNEFYGAFAGMASDAELQRIFQKLDTDGSGTISRLEALNRSNEGTEDNTQSLEEQARDQLRELNGLVSEMTRSTDQFVGLNSTMVSLRDSINALGVAQADIARIEKERAAAEDLARKRLDAERQKSYMTAEIAKSSQIIEEARGNLSANQIANLDGFVHSNAAQGPTAAMDQSDWQRIRDNIQNNPNASLDVKQYVTHLAATLLREENIKELNKIIDGSHSSGLWNVPFDGYVAELHRDEMVVPAQTAGRLRDLPDRAPSMGAMSLPSFPLLGNNDVLETLRDLKREVAELRRDSAQLQSESNKHLAAANNQRGAAAKGQIGAIERGNKMLKRMDDDKRLEAAKR